MIEGISAVTLATHDMARAVAFYRRLGFTLVKGGPDAAFSSFRAGSSFVNLILRPPEERWSWWGRVIIFVDDVDGFYDRARAEGIEPHDRPRDAEWGERFVHVTDPDGHELSFARPLNRRPAD